MPLTMRRSRTTSTATAYLSDPTNRRRDRADSLTDKRHVFNMTGVFQPGFRVTNRLANALLNGNLLSLTIQAASGDLFNIGSNRQLNLDASEPAAFQRPLFIGRNTLRAPSAFELNVRYSRFFPITERCRLEVFAETTNLTNTLNVTTMNSTALVDATGQIVSPATGAATGARDQRLLQFGIRAKLLTTSKPRRSSCLPVQFRNDPGGLGFGCRKGGSRWTFSPHQLQ